MKEAKISKCLHDSFLVFLLFILQCKKNSPCQSIARLPYDWELENKRNDVVKYFSSA